MMKKIQIAFITILCVLMMGVPVLAQNKAVTISAASATKTEAVVAGSTEALAIVVQIRDASDNIIVMESFGTVDGKFNAKLTELNLTEGKTYTIYVADYEGGNWATKDVVVEVPQTTPAETTAANPSQDVASGHRDFRAIYVILILGSAIALSSIGLYALRKKEK